jgi:hypothetical protein
VSIHPRRGDSRRLRDSLQRGLPARDVFTSHPDADQEALLQGRMVYGTELLHMS